MDPNCDMASSDVIDSECCDARGRLFDYAHFGIVCVSWSTLQQMNGGTTSKEEPLGDGSKDNENKGNAQLTAMLTLIEVPSNTASRFHRKPSFKLHLVY